MEEDAHDPYQMILPEESSGTSNPETILGKRWTIIFGYGEIVYQKTGVWECESHGCFSWGA
jgi:hypothetical protein